jgi:hypothetical protein
MGKPGSANKVLWGSPLQEVIFIMIFMDLITPKGLFLLLLHYNATLVSSVP